MIKIKIKSTHELEIYVNNLYEKLKIVAEKDRIFRPLQFHFMEISPPKYPDFGNIDYFDFCYSDGKQYCLCCMGDRGGHIIKKTSSLFEISYWIFKFQTSMMAFDYAKNNNTKGRDIRRIAFSKQLELMKAIGDEYKQKLENEINEILKEHPFQDELYK